MKYRARNIDTEDLNCKVEELLYSLKLCDANGSDQYLVNFMDRGESPLSILSQVPSAYPPL